MIWLIIAFTCAFVYVVLLQKVGLLYSNPPRCAILSKVLLGALLPHISKDLGLQTQIFVIYKKYRIAIKIMM